MARDLAVPQPLNKRDERRDARALNSNIHNILNLQKISPNQHNTTNIKNTLLTNINIHNNNIHLKYTTITHQQHP